MRDSSLQFNNAVVIFINDVELYQQSKLTPCKFRSFLFVKLAGDFFQIDYQNLNNPEVVG